MKGIRIGVTRVLARAAFDGQALLKESSEVWCDRCVCLEVLRSRARNTSKWNPIEHRLFSEISKNWAAEPLNSYQKILNFLRTTTTKTGLAVSAYLDRAHYPTGLEPDPLLFRSLRLRPHKTLPAWNYTITPNL